MNEIFNLIVGMAPYLLLGFLLAGLMHAFIPSQLYQRYLGSHSLKSVFNAALLGIPLPLCSCGVIPTAMSLHREGASRGATISFLIATPQTGVDSIIATYSLLGPYFALLRPIVALITALLGGCIVSLLDTSIEESHSAKNEEASCLVQDKDKNCYCQKQQTFISKMKKAFQYGFIEMMQDIGQWLVLGLIIASLITVLVPEELFSMFSDRPLLSMLLVLLFSIPTYICATGSIPIAVALMLKGLSPGTALVLLMAGPAANVASILVIRKVMGLRILILYLLSIVLGAIGFGLMIDYLLPRSWFDYPLQQLQTCHMEDISAFHLFCFILLALLLSYALIRRHVAPKAPNCNCSENASNCHCSGNTSEDSIYHFEQGESSTSNSHKNIKKDKNEIPYVIIVRGMSCNHCRRNVEDTLIRLPGVTSVSVDLASGKAIIYGNVDRVSAIKAVESLGFEVEQTMI